jgi:hypothetical protein
MENLRAFLSKQLPARPSVLRFPLSSLPNVEISLTSSSALLLKLLEVIGILL